MNCATCRLKELEVNRSEVREVLRCILHTIVFHRALGLVRPKDVDMEAFEITYVQCGDVEHEKKINEKIERFIKWVDKHPNEKNQIYLSFYEVKNGTLSRFANRAKRVYWEQWHITVNVVLESYHTGKSHRSKHLVNPREGEVEQVYTRRAAVEASIREVLFQIIKFVNEKTDHVPPLSSLKGASSFPYEITVPSSSDSVFGMDMIKKILQTGHSHILG